MQTLASPEATLSMREKTSCIFGRAADDAVERRQRRFERRGRRRARAVAWLRPSAGSPRRGSRAKARTTHSRLPQLGEVLHTRIGTIFDKGQDSPRDIRNAGFAATS